MNMLAIFAIQNLSLKPRKKSQPGSPNITMRSPSRSEGPCPAHNLLNCVCRARRWASLVFSSSLPAGLERKQDSMWVLDVVLVFLIAPENQAKCVCTCQGFQRAPAPSWLPPQQLHMAGNPAVYQEPTFSRNVVKLEMKPWLCPGR